MKKLYIYGVKIGRRCQSAAERVDLMKTAGYVVMKDVS